MDPFIQIGVNAVVGLLFQLAVALLLGSVFLAERARRWTDGAYMGFWNAAWLAQAVAVAALVVHLLFMPALNIHRVNEGYIAATVLLGIYASAKMVVWACFLSGSIRYGWQRAWAAALRVLFVVGQAVALWTCLRRPTLGTVMNDLCLVLPFAALCCAAVMWTAHRTRRTAASRAVATLFGLNGLELLAIAVTIHLPAPPEGTWIVNNNSYLDCGVQMLLATGMLWVHRTSSGRAGVPAAPSPSLARAPRAASSPG